MTYTIDVQYRDNVVVANTAGAATYEDAFNLWSTIIAVCEEHHCTRILGVSKTSSMSITTAYDHEKIFTELKISKDYKVAWFVEDPKMLEKIEYLAAVLRNRNLLNGFVFSDLNTAMEWLLEDEN